MPGLEWCSEHSEVGNPDLRGNNLTTRSFSMLEQGVWAEVKVGGEHIRLFSEENALGVQASVYNVNAKNWIAPSESVDDIEQGKDKAAEHARLYLRKAANLELPSLTWKQSRSV